MAPGGRNTSLRARNSHGDLWDPLEPWPLHPADATNLEIVFKALGDRTRLQMLSLLLDQDVLTVSDFQHYLGISQPLASHHLGKLVDAGVVQRSKSGRHSVYWITEGAIKRLSDVFSATQTPLDVYG